MKLVQIIKDAFMNALHYFKSTRLAHCVQTTIIKEFNNECALCTNDISSKHYYLDATGEGDFIPVCGDCIKLNDDGVGWSVILHRTCGGRSRIFTQKHLRIYMWLNNMDE